MTQSPRRRSVRLGPEARKKVAAVLARHALDHATDPDGEPWHGTAAENRPPPPVMKEPNVKAQRRRRLLP